MTYARRAGLECISGIPADDDDGNAAAKAKPRATEADMMPKSMAPDATTPRARPEGQTVPARVTFAYKNGQYSTAGMTKEQFVHSLEWAKNVCAKYKDPNKAHNLLINEFRVASRSDLTEETGAQYLARLKELIDSE